MTRKIPGLEVAGDYYSRLYFTTIVRLAQLYLIASPNQKLHAYDITHAMRCGGHIDDSIQKQGLRKESEGGGEQCAMSVRCSMKKPEIDVKEKKRKGVKRERKQIMTTESVDA